MKLRDYSIVSTADKLGVAIKRMRETLPVEHEVCIKFYDTGGLEVSVHHSLHNEPIATILIPYLEK